MSKQYFIDLSNPKLNLELSDGYAVSKLFSGLANKINNTMASILGAMSLTEILIKTKQDEFEILSTLQKSENYIETMNLLTQRLMMFSKESVAVKKYFDLKTVVQHAITLVFEKQTDTVSIDIKNICKMWGDELLISELLYNLLDNAKQAISHKGTITIKCELVYEKESAYLQKGQYVCISIKDTGTGVDEQFKEKIFEPFVSSFEETSGLGLTIVGQIVRKHKGAIAIDTKKNKYTEIFVYFPVHTEKTNQNKLEKANLSILFVDDNASLREVAYKMLHLLGYNCDTAEDTNVAMELLKKNMYSIIILDLFSNYNVTQHEFLQQVKLQQPDIKSILSSGFTKHEIVANYKKYDFDAVLKKPFSLNELKSTIESLCDDAEEYELN